MALLLMVILEKRKVRNPQKIEGIIIHEFEPTCQLQPQFRQSLVDNVRSIGHKKEEIALFSTKGAAHIVPFLISEKFGNRRLPFSICLYFYPGQTFGAKIADIRGQVVKNFPGKGCAALGIDTFYKSSLFNHSAEDLKAAVFYYLGKANEFQAKPGIRLVSTKPFHCFVICHAGKRRFQINPFCLLENCRHHPFSNAINIFFGNK